MFHGKKRTEITRFANHTFALKSLYWCARHGLWVEAIQWKTEHLHCQAEQGLPLIAGAALALPTDDGVPHIKAMEAHG